MKLKLLPAICLVALFAQPLVAGDAEPKATSVEVRLLEIDLSVLLRQYERLKTEIAEASFKFDLMVMEASVENGKESGKEVNEEARGKELESRARRLDWFRTVADTLRLEALKLGEQLEQAKAKSSPK
ncbi:MAG TPA: hypothetical protein PLX89_14840 [Verrucomicrobiota bacterium]|nr:hypothetical protein [Verrucomicrobiota bacterium]